MPEHNIVSDIERAIRNGLPTLFENLDEVAGDWQADAQQILEQLELSLSDFDLLSEYSRWIADGWYSE